MRFTSKAKAARPTLTRVPVRVSRTKAPAPVCIERKAEGETCFWVHEGPILATLPELYEALESMSDAQFQHHVGKGYNHFADWVRDVLGHGACATKLGKTRSRKSARAALLACMGKQ